MADKRGYIEKVSEHRIRFYDSNNNIISGADLRSPEYLNTVASRLETACEAGAITPGQLEQWTRILIRAGYEPSADKSRTINQEEKLNSNLINKMRQDYQLEQEMSLRALNVASNILDNQRKLLGNISDTLHYFSDPGFDNKAA